MRFGPLGIRHDLDAIGSDNLTVGALTQLRQTTASTPVNVQVASVDDADEESSKFRHSVPTDTFTVDDVTLSGTARRQADGTIDPASGYAIIGPPAGAGTPKRTYRRTYSGTPGAADHVAESIEVWVESRKIISQKGDVVRWEAVLKSYCQVDADYVRTGMD